MWSSGLKKCVNLFLRSVLICSNKIVWCSDQWKVWSLVTRGWSNYSKSCQETQFSAAESNLSMCQEWLLRLLRLLPACVECNCWEYQELCRGLIRVWQISCWAGSSALSNILKYREQSVLVRQLISTELNIGNSQNVTLSDILRVTHSVSALMNPYFSQRQKSGHPDQSVFICRETKMWPSATQTKGWFSAHRQKRGQLREAFK